MTIIYVMLHSLVECPVPTLKAAIWRWMIRRTWPLSSYHFERFTKERGHEGRALFCNKFGTWAVSSRNPRSVNSGACLRWLVRDREVFYELCKELNKRMYLFRRGVNGYGFVISIDVIWKDATDISGSPSSAMNSRFAFRVWYASQILI
jgi:hypothetical protein